MTDELVSVVIPAYNAEDTIDETLRSARSQSHKALEIIIVNDGSDDATASIVRQHALADPRIRMIDQENAGVAAARNRGWQAAQSDLIAFLDADDLWAPAKIERQLAALHRAGGKCGLVYCWYYNIDAGDVITGGCARPSWRGAVLGELFLHNFVGNGSAPLVRRSALVASGGFESGLQNAGAHGCEDLLLYCRIAEAYEFEVVEEPLLGYRSRPGNMSSDMTRMLRSWMLVKAEMLVRHPDCAALLQRGLQDYGVWLLQRALDMGQPGRILPILLVCLRSCPAIGIRIMTFGLLQAITPLAKRTGAAVLRRKRPRTAMRSVSVPFSIGNLE